jgi:hypothetical protein
MKPRDRVRVSLNHQKPDRCPMQISFTPEFAVKLRADMHQTGRSVHNPHGGGNTYELERALGEDLLLTSVGWANSYYANETYANGADTYTDEWGVLWKSAPYETRFGSGFYTEIVGHPLAGGLLRRCRFRVSMLGQPYLRRTSSPRSKKTRWNDQFMKSPMGSKRQRKCTVDECPAGRASAQDQKPRPRLQNCWNTTKTHGRFCQSSACRR